MIIQLDQMLTQAGGHIRLRHSYIILLFIFFISGVNIFFTYLIKNQVSLIYLTIVVVLFLLLIKQIFFSKPLIEITESHIIIRNLFRVKIYKKSNLEIINYKEGYFGNITFKFKNDTVTVYNSEVHNGDLKLLSCTSNNDKKGNGQK